MLRTEPPRTPTDKIPAASRHKKFKKQNNNNKMAALQTLRNKPALLMSVIGGALLLFIVTLTDLNSCSRPNVEAEVNGQELTVQDFEAQVGKEESLLQLLSMGSLTDDQKNNIREDLFERFQQVQLIKKQADKLGITVTDEDVQFALSNVDIQGIQQKLQRMQYGQMSWAAFSYAERIMILLGNYRVAPTIEAYKQFLKTIDQQIAQAKQQNAADAVEQLQSMKDACLYAESQIADDVMLNKYLSLIALGQLSNPVSAKIDYAENATTVDYEMAIVPFSTITDDQVKVTDEDLKKVYDEHKSLFRIYQPSRDLKIISVGVTASNADQQNIFAQVRAVEDSLRGATTAEQVEKIMRSSKTDAEYQNAYFSKKYLENNNQTALVAAIDSLKGSSVLATKLEAANGRDTQAYISAYKLVGTVTTPDSLRVVQLIIDDKAKADSIAAALKAGSSYAAQAKKYDADLKKLQSVVDTSWVNMPFYVAASTQNDTTNTLEYTHISQVPTGKTTVLFAGQTQDGKPAYSVLTVIETKGGSEKYNIAAVRYPVTFSTQTYNGKRAALQEFLAKNRTIADIEKNALKAGFTVISRPNFTTSDAMQYRTSIGGEGAKSAFIWAYDEAKAGEISAVFECGKENDQLLVIAVEGINDGDYLAWNNPTIKTQLEMLARQEKKAEKILEMTKNVKNIEAAKAVKGAQTDTQTNFPISQIANFEPTVAGALQRMKAGEFSGAVKGQQGIAFIKLIKKNFDEKGFEAAKTQSMQNGVQQKLYSIFQTNSFFNTLSNKGKIKDNRYKF